MKMKKCFNKVLAAVMLLIVTVFSVSACSDKGTSSKASEPGAVQGDFYLDGDTTKQYISFNEDNSFRFVGYDYDAFAKELFGDELEDNKGFVERLDDAYTYRFDDKTKEIRFDIWQSDEPDAAEFLTAMQLSDDGKSVVFHEKIYKIAE